MKRIALIALAGYVGSILLEDSVPIEGIGSVSRIVGVIAFVIGTAAMLSRKRVVRPGIEHALLFVFVCLNAVSILWTLDTESTVARILSYAMQLGFVWLMLQLVETDSDRMFVIGTWVLGAVAAAVGSVYSYLTGTDFVAHTDRYSVAGADPNELALGLALAVPLTWYLGFKLRNSGARIFFRLCTLPLVVGIIFTGSRGGAIALLASLMVIPLCRKQIGIITKGTIILCCIAALTAGAALVPEGSLKRLSSIGDEISRNDMAGRGVLWSAGWAQFKQHPFVGVGAGAYPISISVAANATMVAHNTFISVLTELGCMGFAVYLLILARLLYLVLRMPNPERFVWFVVFLSWGIGVCALTWENSKPTWLIFALILAQSRQSQAEREGYYDESLLGQAGTAMEVVS